MLSPEDLRPSIASQFQSELAMLCRAIELFPESVWLEGSPNRSWHIAYHALFYLHFYLAPSDAEFTEWPKHRPEYNYLGEVPRRPGYKPVIDEPYTAAELLEYADFCRAEIRSCIAAIDLTAPSGFFWLQFDKLQLQFYNLRHLSHHTGQLAERLRSYAGIGLLWVR